MLPPSISYACSQSLRAKLNLIESQLLRHPQNQALQTAYRLLIQKCQQAQATTHSTAQFMLTSGYNTNPLQSSTQKNFTLTLPQVNLLIPNTSVPQPAAYQQLQFQYQQQRHNHSLLYTRIQLKHWSSQTLQSESQLQLILLQPQSARSHLMFLASHLVNQFATLNALGLGWLYAQTKAQHRLMLLNQNSPQSLYNQTTLQYQLQFPSITLYAQQEIPTQSRAGENRTTIGLQLHRQWSLSTCTQVTAAYQIQVTQDDQGYSPYLENNQRRQTRYQQLNLQLEHQLTQQWQSSMQLQFNQQDSNIALFQWKGAQVQINLQYKIKK